MEPTRVTRVILVEDDPAFRSGLKSLIASQPHLEVAAEAATPEAAVEVVARNAAELVLLDLSLPRLDGFEVLKHIRGKGPAPKVLVLSIYALDEVAATAFAAGADGYCTKTVGRDALLEAIAEVMRGGRVCCLEQ